MSYPVAADTGTAWRISAQVNDRPYMDSTSLQAPFALVPVPTAHVGYS